MLSRGKVTDPKYREHFYATELQKILVILAFIQKSLGVCGGPLSTLAVRCGFSLILDRVTVLQAAEDCVNPAFKKNLAQISNLIISLDLFKAQRLSYSCSIEDLAQLQLKLSSSVGRWVGLLGSISHWNAQAAEARAFRVREYRSVWDIDAAVEFRYRRPLWWSAFYRPSPIRPNTKIFWKKFYKPRWKRGQSVSPQFKHPWIGMFVNIKFYRQRVSDVPRKFFVLTHFFKQPNRKLPFYQKHPFVKRYFHRDLVVPLVARRLKTLVMGGQNSHAIFLNQYITTYPRRIYKQLNKLVRGNLNPGNRFLVLVGIGAYLGWSTTGGGLNKTFKEKHHTIQVLAGKKRRVHIKGVRNLKKTNFNKNNLMQVVRFRGTRPLCGATGLPISIYAMFRRNQPWLYRPLNHSSTEEGYRLRKALFRGSNCSSVRDRLQFEKLKWRRWTLRRRFSTFRTIFKVPPKVFKRNVGYFRYRVGRTRKFCRVFLTKPTRRIRFRLLQARRRYAVWGALRLNELPTTLRQQRGSSWAIFLKKRLRRRRWLRPAIRYARRRACWRQVRRVVFFLVKVPTKLWWHTRFRRPKYWHLFRKRKPQKSRKLLFRARVLLRAKQPWRFRRTLTAQLTTLRSPVSGFWWFRASVWPVRRRRVSLDVLRVKQLRIAGRRNGRRSLALLWLAHHPAGNTSRVFWLWFSRRQARQHFKNSFIQICSEEVSRQKSKTVVTTPFVWRRWARFNFK